MSSLVARVWFGRGPAARLARAALWPAELAYRAASAVRNGLYDRGMLAVMPPAIPAISVGNLTVGGTGKTPMTAWLVAELSRRGARPAVVLRGYGADEPLVHQRLNPGVPVVCDADRAAGLRRARADGATVAVLDDAFQHRRIGRVADLVLVAAERGLLARRLLPAGPYRESVGALGRASLVVVTRKTATLAQAAAVMAQAAKLSDAPGAVVSLAPASLERVDGGASLPLDALRGRRVVLVTGVGEPGFLADQLRALGAEVELHAFPDHHAFTDADLAGASAAAAEGDMAVCTLKDAVKISSRWPGRVPLWYVSQRLSIDLGMEHMEEVLEATLARLRSNPPTAG